MTLTAIQHEERLTGLGASDSAVALGLSKWKTPLELHLEKCQEIGAPDIGDKPLIKWGNRLETAIADGWAEDTGIKVARVNQTLRHPEHNFMICHLDRRQVGRKRVLECKNVNQFYGNQAFGDDGSDQVPDNYLVQVHHQISICRALWGWQGGELAALIGGNDLRTYSFEYDAELEEMMISRLAAFWQGVLDRTPPAPTTVSDLEMLYAEDNGSIKEVTDPEIVNAWIRLHELKASAKETKTKIEAEELTLKMAIAEAAGIQFGFSELDEIDCPGISYAGKTLATWKKQTKSGIDNKSLKAEQPEIFNRYYGETSSFRVLRLTKTG